VLGGHSMGAGVSSALGAQFPGLVRALILEDPNWRISDPTERKQEQQAPRPNPFAAWLMTLQGKTIEECIAKCRLDSPTWAEIELFPWAESKKQFDLTFFQTESGHQQDWQEDVKAITCPVLLITADTEKGALVPKMAAQKAVSLNPLVQFVKIEGAGHNIRRENFPAYMKAVREFLKQ